MGERKRIGLFFTYNENWIGGTYYILNLIEALKLLPIVKQPELSIFYINDEDIKNVEAIGYPFIHFSKLNHKGPFIKRGIRFVIRKIFGKEIFKPTPYKKYRSSYFDAIFPASMWFNNEIAKKLMYWIPDFQEAHLPHLFSEKEIAYRKLTQRLIANSGETVIFSSYDAMKDFENLYPESKVKRRVLQFAVTHPYYNEIDFEGIRKKYRLPDNYFFCPNQFWVHKNHKVILEAIGKLKQKFNKSVQVVFTGKAYDQRNNTYYGELEKFIDENDIKDNILVLGFIDRKEQLLIMQNALAIIQPSLFEGWSTVVEDVKAMDQNIIVSHLGVHKEQLNEKATYFDPTDHVSLVKAILSFKKEPVEFAYEINRRNFAYNFLNIIDE